MLVQTERCHNTRYITVCYLWSCTATDQSGCPCWPLPTAESTNNGHVSIRTGIRSNGRRCPGRMNYASFTSLDRVCVRCLPGEHMVPGCTIGRRQASRGSVILWAMFCWETLCSAIHVDVTLTCTTYLNIVADHGQPFMETVCPDGCGLFQQDKVVPQSEHGSGMVWGAQQRVWGVDLALKFPKSDLWTPHLQRTGLLLTSWGQQWSAQTFWRAGVKIRAL